MGREHFNNKGLLSQVKTDRHHSLVIPDSYLFRMSFETRKKEKMASYF